jgi:type IV secretory pathway VirB10-like protein
MIVLARPYPLRMLPPPPGPFGMLEMDVRMEVEVRMLRPPPLPSKPRPDARAKPPPAPPPHPPPPRSPAPAFCPHPPLLDTASERAELRRKECPRCVDSGVRRPLDAETGRPEGWPPPLLLLGDSSWEGSCCWRWEGSSSCDGSRSARSKPTSDASSSAAAAAAAAAAARSAAAAARSTAPSATTPYVPSGRWPVATKSAAVDRPVAAGSVSTTARPSSSRLLGFECWAVIGFGGSWWASTGREGT